MPQAGKEITAQEAQKYMDKYLEIKSKLQITLPNKCDDSTMQAIKYHQSETNAFIFSKELVTRFFEAGAEYLMVIIGAKHSEPESLDKSMPKNGDPTVVIAGVNKNDDSSYTSLDIPKAADQQPPSTGLVKFPPKPDKNQFTEWTFKVNL